MDEERSRREQREARKQARARDRSKFKKTDHKKWERQQLETIKKKGNRKELLRGRVLAIYPESIAVEHEGKVIACVLRGLLKKETKKVKNLVTVGDFVLFADNVIAYVEERRSVLMRQEHLRRREQQLIAANIDQVLITSSVREPSLKPALIDRYIIATYKGKMEPVIVLNKVDLMEPGSEMQEVVEELMRVYRRLGIPVLLVSAATGEGMDRLMEQMRGRASVFSGQSGTGKSSLINWVTGLDLATAGLAKKTGKGSHTTTAARLIPLSCGGWCIDTPGIRSFGVWDLTREDLRSYFPEIETGGRMCRYPDCTHVHEPDCAVRQAVEAGEISPFRFESYIKLLEETI